MQYWTRIRRHHCLREGTSLPILSHDDDVDDDAGGNNDDAGENDDDSMKV